MFRRLVIAVIGAMTLAAGLASPSQAGGKQPLNYAALVRATNDFGYWMTYYARNNTVKPSQRIKPVVVNGRIARYVGMRAPGNGSAGANVGQLTGAMHLMNTPSGMTYHIDRYSPNAAIETVHWLFGSNPHTPVVRLTWTFGPVGWTITYARFIRNS